MPKYVCENEDCKMFFELQYVEKSKISFKNGKMFDSGSICPECKEVMKPVNPEGYTTHMTGSENICKK